MMRSKFLQISISLPEQLTGPPGLEGYHARSLYFLDTSTGGQESETTFALEEKLTLDEKLEMRAQVGLLSCRLALNSVCLL